MGRTRACAEKRAGVTGGQTEGLTCRQGAWMLLQRRMEAAVPEATLPSEVRGEAEPSAFTDNATELQRPTHQGVADDLPPQVAHQAQVPAEVFHGEESEDVPQDFAGQATNVALGLLAG